MTQTAAAAAPVPVSRVYLATAGVFLGAGIASLGGRLVSVGLPDVRGALGFGFDEASWIPTIYNAATMFMGPVSVYLGALVGRRRVLLRAGAIYFLASLLLPFSPNLTTMLVLQLISGLASGTFYPLSLSYALQSLPLKFTIFGIGAYSMELLSTLCLGTPLEGWFIEHWSWKWIYWSSCVLVVVMMVLIHFGFPRNPPAAAGKPGGKSSWRGFLLLSLGLAALFAALDQGERLNWFDSGTTVALVVVGGLLVAGAAFERWRHPDPLVNIGFLFKRNTLLLGCGLFSLRFVLLGILVVIPGFLGAVQGFRPEQTGTVLLYLAGPVIVFGFLGAHAMRHVENRLVAALGFAAVATACLLDSRLTSDWARGDFFWTQLLMAAGLAIAFVGQVGLIAQQAVDSGGPKNPVNILAYGAFFQGVRLFGGQIGIAIMQHFIVVRSRYHTAILDASVQAGSYLTDDYLRAVTGDFASGVTSTDALQARVLSTLGRDVGKQVTTLSYIDGFVLIAGVCAAMIVIYACVRPMRMYFAAKASSLG